MKFLVTRCLPLQCWPVVPAQAAANETVRVYGIIMESAETVQQKYAVALSMAALNDPAAAVYAMDALDWALANRSTITPGFRARNIRAFYPGSGKKPGRLALYQRCCIGHAGGG
jgi:hypothetical protein